MSEPSLVFSRLHLPQPLDSQALTRLLARLTTSDTPRPLVFESRADHTGITHLVGYHVEAAQRVRQLLEAQLNGIRLDADAYRDDVGSARRVTLTPRSLPLDDDGTQRVLHSLYAVFASRRGDELIVVQVVLGRGYRPHIVPAKVADPTQLSLWDALTVGSRPAPGEVRRRLADWAGQPRLDVAVRLGVSAATPARRAALAHDLRGAMQGVEAPGVRLGLAHEAATRLDFGTRGRSPLQLSPAELVPFLSWPVDDIPLPGMPAAHPRRLAAPSTLTDSEAVFATSTAPGDERKIGMLPAARLQHLVATGPTGSGKSVGIFAPLILSDIAAGRPCVVIDPKRQLVDYIVDHAAASAAGQIVILDAAEKYPVGFNPLDTRGRNADVVVDGILAAFKAVFEDGWGPRTEDLLHAGLLTLARSGEARSEPHTLLDLPRLLTDASFRRNVVGAVAADPTLSSFWAGFEEMGAAARANLIAAPMNKLRKYVLRRSLTAVLGQARPKFRLRDVFQEGKTILVPLNDALLGPGAAQLLGSLVVAEVWMATLERAAEQKPTARPGMVFVDEVQQFLNLPTSIADVLSTSRSYGVGWHLAHQFREQLSPSMRAAFDSNARSKVVFSVGPHDARDLAQMATGLDAEDFKTLPPYEIYANLVDTTGPAGWFSARTLTPTTDAGNGAAIRKASQALYGADAAALPETGDTEVLPRPIDDPPSAPAHRKARRP